MTEPLLVTPSYDINLDGPDLADTTYARLVVSYHLTYELTGEWVPAHQPQAAELGSYGTIAYTKVGTAYTQFIIDGTTAALSLLAGRSALTFRVAARTADEAQAIVAALRRAYPPARYIAPDTISVRFWYLAERGPESLSRMIAAPEWLTIAGNYEGATRERLDHLMGGAFRPSHGGQIIVWHGPAGTGKTYALRALCQAWRGWCSAEYVIDPDNLFGSRAGYLVNLLLASPDIRVTMTADTPAAIVEAQLLDAQERAAEQAWKLLILEDTGELVTGDAKARSGQGLSRLLNVADGFIGQGLRVLVLITTNETIDKLHEAVRRPGRAASLVHFGPLSTDGANAWLRAHDLPPGMPGFPRTLSELYALKEEYANPNGDGMGNGRTFGFVPDLVRAQKDGPA